MPYRYGTPEQQEQWLLPLLRGRIRSCFAMTEKLVASSDATNITAAITRSSDGKAYRVQGLKWWTSGAMDPRCKVGWVLCLGGVLFTVTGAMPAGGSWQLQHFRRDGQAAKVSKW